MPWNNLVHIPSSKLGTASKMGVAHAWDGAVGTATYKTMWVPKKSTYLTTIKKDSKWFPVTMVSDTSLVDSPFNLKLPVVNGAPVQGFVLTVSNGSWAAPGTMTYQWTRDGVNIAGATSQNYTLVVGDATKTIACKVTSTNANGATTATSNGVGPIV